MTTPVRARRAAAPVLVAVAACLLILAPSAQSAPVTDGTLDWGVRESFRNYVTSPIAAGSIETGQGATKNSDGTFRFPGGTGEFDTSTNSGEVAYEGFVHFTAHGGLLDLELSNPRVVISGQTGSLFVDGVDSNGQPSENVDFADLDLTGIAPVVDGDTVTLTAIPGVFTEDGATFFNGGDNGSYAAGDEIDPLTLELSAAAAPAAVGKIKPGKRVQKASSGELLLAKVNCKAADGCKVKAPRKVALDLKGPDIGTLVKVKRPKKLAAGEKGAVTVKLGKDLQRTLDGLTAKTEADIALVAGGEKLEEKVKVKVKG
jgi:hypothetical protein